MIQFLPIRWLDLLDILLVAFLLFQVYKLIKGTVAIRIFLGILAIYLLWKIVSAMQMELLSEILGQFIGVGVLALIIVFQQEIRRFLLLLGSQSPFGGKGLVRKFLKWSKQSNEESQENINAIVRACEKMSRTKTGSLIVISLEGDLSLFTETGKQLDAVITTVLLESIFFKNSPLHDGGVIIYQNRIKRAGCVFPISENPSLPQKYGLRHRAGIGITENSSAISIMISEESGEISVAIEGRIKPILDNEHLKDWLNSHIPTNA